MIIDKPCILVVYEQINAFGVDDSYLLALEAVAPIVGSEN